MLKGWFIQGIKIPWRVPRVNLHGLYQSGERMGAATYPSVHVLFSVKFGFARRRKIHLLSVRSGNSKLHTQDVYRTASNSPTRYTPPIYLLLDVCPRYHGACVVYHPLSSLTTPLVSLPLRRQLWDEGYGVLGAGRGLHGE